MKKLLYKNTGFSALLSIIIIVSITLTIALGINISGMNEMQDSLSYSLSSESFFAADSCVEEALLRMKREDNYAGGNLITDDINCSISVTDLGSDMYTIQATASVNDEFYRQIEVQITRTTTGVAKNITIDSWKET